MWAYGATPAKIHYAGLTGCCCIGKDIIDAVDNIRLSGYRPFARSRHDPDKNKIAFISHAPESAVGNAAIPRTGRNTGNVCTMRGNCGIIARGAYHIGIRHLTAIRKAGWRSSGGFLRPYLFDPVCAVGSIVHGRMVIIKTRVYNPYDHVFSGHRHRQSVAALR